MKKITKLATAAAAAASSFFAQPAAAYPIDCAILLCLAGGWPASVECAQAKAEFIRRITPWPVEPPLQIWRCPMRAASLSDDLMDPMTRLRAMAAQERELSTRVADGSPIQPEPAVLTSDPDEPAGSDSLLQLTTTHRKTARRMSISARRSLISSGRSVCSASSAPTRFSNAAPTSASNRSASGWEAIPDRALSGGAPRVSRICPRISTASSDGTIRTVPGCPTGRFSSTGPTTKAPTASSRWTTDHGAFGPVYYQNWYSHRCVISWNRNRFRIAQRRSCASPSCAPI
jgi:hypothetical protein